LETRNISRFFLLNAIQVYIDNQRHNELPQASMTVVRKVI
jgi:hypothetical protein